MVTSHLETLALISRLLSRLEQMARIGTIEMRNLKPVKVSRKWKKKDMQTFFNTGRNSVLLRFVMIYNTLYNFIYIYFFTQMQKKLRYYTQGQKKNHYKISGLSELWNILLILQNIFVLYTSLSLNSPQ